MDHQLGDWAAWDETYAFVAHPTPDYITRNIQRRGQRDGGFRHQIEALTVDLPARRIEDHDRVQSQVAERAFDRQAWSRQQTLEYITEQSGRHFDPAVVTASVHLLGDTGITAAAS